MNMPPLVYRTIVHHRSRLGDDDTLFDMEREGSRYGLALKLLLNRR